MQQVSQQPQKQPPGALPPLGAALALREHVMSRGLAAARSDLSPTSNGFYGARPRTGSGGVSPTSNGFYGARPGTGGGGVAWSRRVALGTEGARPGTEEAAAAATRWARQRNAAAPRARAAPRLRRRAVWRRAVMERTPKDLLERGVFKSLAVPLYDGEEHQRVCLRVIMHAMVGAPDSPPRAASRWAWPPRRRLRIR